MSGVSGRQIIIIGLATSIVLVASICLYHYVGNLDHGGNELAVPDDDSRNDPLIWNYDDYRQINNVSSAQGALEIVNVGSSQYVHACQVGYGTYVANGITVSVMVNKAQLDVFLIAGQSNAEYRTMGGVDLSTASPSSPIGVSYYYGSDIEPIHHFGLIPEWRESFKMHDSISSEGVNRLGHLECAFSSYYYQYTGHKVYTINTGIGSMASINFVPGGSVYEWSKEVFALAMNAVDTSYYSVQVKSYIWLQGEFDYCVDESHYMCNYLAWHNSLIGNSPAVFNQDYQFESGLIVKTRTPDPSGPSTKTNSVVAAKAQIELAGRYSTIKMATIVTDSFNTLNGLLLSDELHYSQLGHNVIGHMLANIYNKQSLDPIVSPHVIDNIGQKMTYQSEGLSINIEKDSGSKDWIINGETFLPGTYRVLFLSKNVFIRESQAGIPTLVTYKGGSYENNNITIDTTQYVHVVANGDTVILTVDEKTVVYEGQTYAFYASTTGKYVSGGYFVGDVYLSDLNSAAFIGVAQQQIFGKGYRYGAETILSVETPEAKGGIYVFNYVDSTSQPVNINGVGAGIYIFPATVVYYSFDNADEV